MGERNILGLLRLPFSRAAPSESLRMDRGLEFYAGIHSRSISEVESYVPQRLKPVSLAGSNAGLRACSTHFPEMFVLFLLDLRDLAICGQKLFSRELPEA